MTTFSWICILLLNHRRHLPSISTYTKFPYQSFQSETNAIKNWNALIF